MYVLRGHVEDGYHRASRALNIVSVAVEMHNTFVKEVVFTETPIGKAISLTKLVFRIQLCVSMACHYLYLRTGKGPSARLWQS
jgi:hypothetical protein